MSTLKALVTLKPHGNNLCDLKARMWLLLMRSSILMIAGCEAAAWGFIGYLMAEGTYPWIAAVLIGGAVGCLIGGLDAAFVMVDLSKMRRASPAVSASFQGVLSFLKAYVTKAHLGVFMRMVMVAVSLAITAPFLAQLLFSRDIAARQQKANDAMLSAARSEIVIKHQERAEFLRLQLRRLENILSQEIAGQGPSKRYGRGPVVDSLEKQIDSIAREIASSERAAAQNLARFDKADPETLARQYGVSLSTDGIVARFEALREMETIPGFRWTENAFRILLAGFFLGLIVYKWYEPASLQIYFDEELQSAFADVLAGRYKQFFDDSRGASPSQVSPVWFSKWYYESARERERAERLHDRLAAITSRHSSFETAVNELIRHPGSELQDLQEHSARLAGELEALRGALQKEKGEVYRIEAEITQCDSRVAEAAAVLETLSDYPKDAARLIAKRTSWEEKLQELRGVLRRQNLIVDETQRQHDLKDVEWNQLKVVIETAGRTMAEIRESLIKARTKAVHELSAVQQET